MMPGRVPSTPPAPITATPATIGAAKKAALRSSCSHLLAADIGAVIGGSRGRRGWPAAQARQQQRRATIRAEIRVRDAVGPRGEYRKAGILRCPVRNDTPSTGQTKPNGPGCAQPTPCGNRQRHPAPAAARLPAAGASHVSGRAAAPGVRRRLSARPVRSSGRAGNRGRAGASISAAGRSAGSARPNNAAPAASRAPANRRRP